ncbi:MAG: hypothetical protein HOI53_01460 [Francisellaceae bacterium]|nr:hypothetical protein [Francisellaceae bacterium]MBT6206669.1 hypothetical protein [Francisellaceae bacterium]
MTVKPLKLIITVKEELSYMPDVPENARKDYEYNLMLAARLCCSLRKSANIVIKQISTFASPEAEDKLPPSMLFVNDLVLAAERYNAQDDAVDTRSGVMQVQYLESDIYRYAQELNDLFNRAGHAIKMLNTDPFYEYTSLRESILRTKEYFKKMHMIFPEPRKSIRYISFAEELSQLSSNNHVARTPEILPAVGSGFTFTLQRIGQKKKESHGADYGMNTLLYSSRLHKTFQTAYKNGQKEDRERSGYGEGAMTVYSTPGI